MAPRLPDSADTEQPGDLGLPTPPHELPALSQGSSQRPEAGPGSRASSLGSGSGSNLLSSPQPSAFQPLLSKCGYCLFTSGVFSMCSLSQALGLPKSLELGWDTCRERQSSSPTCVTTEPLCLPAGCTAVQGRGSKILNLRATTWPRLHGFWGHSHCKRSAVDWLIDGLIPRIHLTEKQFPCSCCTHTLQAEMSIVQA